MQDITVRLTIQGDLPTEGIAALLTGRALYHQDGTAYIAAAQQVSHESLHVRLKRGALDVLRGADRPLTIADIAERMGIIYGVAGAVTDLLADRRVRARVPASVDEFASYEIAPEEAARWAA